MTRPLTEDQRAFQETAERFTREKIAPLYMAREKDGRVDRALVREMGALGLNAMAGWVRAASPRGLRLKLWPMATSMFPIFRCWLR